MLLLTNHFTYELTTVTAAATDLCHTNLPYPFSHQVHGLGELRVNKALDRELINRYSLTVAATDGAFVTYTAVDIFILDDNDNAPVCTQASNYVCFC